jgi:hypothetical protein
MNDVVEHQLGEIKEQTRSLALQVQLIADAMQIMAAQMGLLSAATKARLEVLAAASLAVNDKPKKVVDPTDEDEFPPGVPT